MRGPLDPDDLAVASAPAGVEVPSVEWLRAQPDVREAVVLATCRRAELYVVGSVTSPGGSWRQSISPAFSTVHTGALAAHHLFRVACGLDSPILGDGQVLAQVRRSYLSARESGTTGPWLNRLFETALSAGKRVRHRTDLVRGATTSAAAAVGVAERLAGGLTGRHVLIVGAGDTATLAARHVAHRRPARLTIANRTRGLAETLAMKFSGVAIGLDSLTAAIHDADVVVSATASPGTLIDAVTLGAVMSLRPARPLVAVDLAIPRDIEVACGEIPGVTRVGLEQVEAEASTGRELRQSAVPEAEAIAADAVRSLTAWAARRGRLYHFETYL